MDNILFAIITKSSTVKNEIHIININERVFRKAL